MEKFNKNKNIDGVIWTSKLDDKLVKSYNAFGYCVVDNQNRVKKIVEKDSIKRS